MRLRRAAGRLLVEEEERRSVLIFLCVLLTFLCVAAALAGVGRRPAPLQGEDRLHAARPGRPIDRKRRGHSQAMLEPAGHGRHRWSGRRPRLTLTESGFRDTGARFRFCLDCTAERCEEPHGEMPLMSSTPARPLPQNGVGILVTGRLGSM